MATTGDCETLLELLPAFAFGLLDEDEKAKVETLLPLCPEAAVDLNDYQGLALRMLHSSTEMEPPPHLLAKLLQATTPASSAKPVAPLPVTSPTRLASAAPRLRRLPRPGVWLLTGAAAVLLIVFLTGLVLMQTMQLSQTVQAQNTLLNLVANDQVVRFDLTDPADAPTNAHAVLLCNADERVAVIQAENFPVADADSSTQYQIWLWPNRDTRIDGGILTVNANGWGTMVFEAPDVMKMYQYVSVAPVNPVNGQNNPVVRASLYPLATPQTPS